MAVGITRNYAIDDTALIFGGVPLSEYASGDAIVVTFNEDDFVVVQGSHGSVLRAKKHNNIAEMVVRIMQGSPANDFLSFQHNLDRNTRMGSVPCLLKDLLGNTFASSAQAWIKKFAEIKLAEEGSEVEWTIVLSNPQLAIGANLPV